jgi:hypothetical protein
VLNTKIISSANPISLTINLTTLGEAIKLLTYFSAFNANYSSTPTKKYQVTMSSIKSPPMSEMSKMDISEISMTPFEKPEDKENKVEEFYDAVEEDDQKFVSPEEDKAMLKAISPSPIRPQRIAEVYTMNANIGISEINILVCA